MNNILNKIYGLQFKAKLKYLINQLLWGNTFINPFWYLWDLIVTTFVYNIIIFLFKKKYLSIFIILFIISYILQYSGYNKIFYSYLGREKRECLCRLTEMFPLSVTGFILAHFEIIKHLEKYRYKSFILSLMFFNLIPKIKVPYEFYGGIAYPGIKINILSVYLIFIFSLFLTENISNKLINKNIKVILNYTGGIFYLHWSIIGYFRPLIKPIKSRTIFGCFIVYLVCYIICFILT